MTVTVTLAEVSEIIQTHVMTGFVEIVVLMIDHSEIHATLDHIIIDGGGNRLSNNIKKCIS